MNCFLLFFILVLSLKIISILRKRKTAKYDPCWPYLTPGIFYPLKVLVFYLLLRYRRASDAKGSSKRRKSKQDLLNSLEKPQLLPVAIKAIDAMFFSGYSKEGWGVVMAMGRRPMRVSSVVIYLKTPEDGIYVLPQHPDCMHFREELHEDVFRAGGLSFSPEEPMKRWRLNFEGQLRKANEPGGKLVKTKIQLTWSSEWGYFDYEKDADSWTMAKVFARENWTRVYFENLKEHHQVHYEQMGQLEGTITFDEKNTEVKMSSFRDHSFGKREWNLMHRYAFHQIFLDDGSKGVFGVVCQPHTCSGLVCGHWWTPDGKGSPVTHTDFELFQHGEGGTPPSDYAFTFVAGGIKRFVKVSIEMEACHFLEWDWEAKLYERWAKLEVDDAPGKGVCEFQYHNSTGRPSNYTEKDPQWTKKLRFEYLTS